MGIPQPIPVTIIAGFLGAGKTTLLNRILRADHDRRLAVLVNDFGQVNIDTQLLESAADNPIVDLPNGCICCTLARDLAGVIRQLFVLADPPEQIIIEASGVSSPGDIESILDVPELVSLVRVSGIITLVDAENALRLAQAVMFMEAQVAAADLVLLNKIDLVDGEHLANVLEWIKSIAPDAYIAQTTYAGVPMSMITGDNQRTHNNIDFLDVAGHDGDVHSHFFRSWTFNTTGALSRELLTIVIENLPPTIYRVKGLLYFAGDPVRRYVLQVVGRRVSIQAEGAWGEQEPRSQLVFIGESDGFEPARLEAALTACIL